MDIAGTAQDVMMRQAQYSQELGVRVMKQALAQDAAVLQVVSGALHPASPAPIMPSTGGIGHGLDIRI